CGAWASSCGCGWPATWCICSPCSSRSRACSDCSCPSRRCGGRWPCRAHDCGGRACCCCAWRASGGGSTTCMPSRTPTGRSRDRSEVPAVPGGTIDLRGRPRRKEAAMAAMKPRTGDGPMEAVKEGRLIIVRVPLEGGGRLVVSVNDAEAKELHDALGAVVDAA